MKKNYLETLQMNISNSYYEKRKPTCIFKQHSLFDSPSSVSRSGSSRITWKKQIALTSI